MWLIKLAWKNLWRNRNRTIITMTAIFFATLLSILAQSLQNGVFDNLIKNVVSFHTGYVQVHKQGYWDEQILENSFADSAETGQKILQSKNVNSFSPRLESFALASAQDVTKGCLVTGIDPQKEDRIMLLQNKLILGTYLTKNDTALLVSQGLAERLKLTVNDTMVLIGQGYHGATAAGKYRIKGIVKFGTPELNDIAVFMPLTLAQDFFNAYGMITSYVLSLQDTKNLQPTAALVRGALGPAYEVMTWEEIIPDIKQHIETDTNSTKYIRAILYLLICFGIFGTLLMMMVERKFELGMLVAIGMKKAKLSLLLLYESVLTVLMGCIIGVIAGIPVVYYLSIHPVKMGKESAAAFERFGFEAIFPTSTDSSIFISQGIIVLLIGLLLSLYPIYKVIRLNPVTAMKH